MKNFGAYSSSTLNVLSDLGRRINDNSGDARETAYLFQRISVAIQHFNSVFLQLSTHRTYSHPDFVFIYSPEGLWANHGFTLWAQNGLRAVGYNSTESESIWTTAGII